MKRILKIWQSVSPKPNPPEPQARAPRQVPAQRTPSSATTEEFLLELCHLSKSFNMSPLFTGNGVMLSEWAFLKTVSSHPIPLSRITKGAKVPRDISRTMVRKLTRAGLIYLDKGAEEAAGSRIVRLSPKGADLLVSVSTGLAELDKTETDRKMRVRHSLVRLLRVMQRPTKERK